MEYVIGTMCAILIGWVGGWFFYQTTPGSKKDQLCAGILWGVGVAIISVLAAFGG